MADEVDRLFQALSDRNRRTMLLLLAGGRKKVTELAANFEMSLPAVSKHIRVLEAAGLISRTIEGRDHYLSANPGALGAASAQIALLQGMWNDTLQRLDEAFVHQEETMSNHTARASRVINAPPERLFDAWITGEIMSRFMCPIPGGSAMATSEAKVGGTFTVEMIAPDGQSIPHHGVYRTIDRPKKLVFTWNSPYTTDSIVTITFEAKAGGTEVSLVHELLADAEQAKSHTDGWIAILEQLSGIVA